jgi:hypothetical protein
MKSRHIIEKAYSQSPYEKYILNVADNAWIFKDWFKAQSDEFKEKDERKENYLTLRGSCYEPKDGSCDEHEKKRDGDEDKGIPLQIRNGKLPDQIIWNNLSISTKGRLLRKLSVAIFATTLMVACFLIIRNLRINAIQVNEENNMSSCADVQAELR